MKLKSALLTALLATAAGIAQAQSVQTFENQAVQPGQPSTLNAPDAAPAPLPQDQAPAAPAFNSPSPSVSTGAGNNNLNTDSASTRMGRHVPGQYAEEGRRAGEIPTYPAHQYGDTIEAHTAR
jgi:hypothetical protein